ncbi:GAF domain-containing sensor histidine kinase [Arthrobacter alpinus]|uniref:GAF domain-containing sensor histidine kinase n=1 Tax=Arthrobacter alpinus TaxID=656366 RepID=UPI0009E73151|nr:GAF domain-containing protein [Arthrobacter alpinus]
MSEDISRSSLPVSHSSGEPGVEDGRSESALPELESNRAQERMRGLLSAVVSLAEEPNLDAVLRRIVESACQLLDAQYGALGVIGDGLELSRFITVGVDAPMTKLIGPLPTGHGVLGLLIRDPKPIRLPDLHLHPDSFGFPPHHPPMTTFLGVPILARGAVFGNLYLTEKRGGKEFTPDDEYLAVALAVAAGSAIENAKLFDEAQRRSAWLKACADVTAQLMADDGSEPQRSTELIADRALAVSDSLIALVVVSSPTDRGSNVSAAAGQGAGHFMNRSMKLDAVAAQRMRDTGAPAAFTTASELLGSDGEGLGPVLMTPLGTSGQYRRVLIVARGIGAQSYTQATAKMAEFYGSQAALGLQLVRSHRLREQMVVFRDRDRIAKDLHDLVIQRLFAAGLNLQSLSRYFDSPEAAQRLLGITSELDSTIRELRNTIYSLGEVAEELELLSSQILQTVLNSAKSSALTPRLHLTGPIDSSIPMALGRQLLTVLSEALSNAVRHSQARDIEVSVKADDHQVQIKVTDNGVGFRNPARRSGLSNMEERALSLGGTCSVRSDVGEGTCVLWMVPLSRGKMQGILS